jgi:uncharacterized membrane protein YeaQ/YmgE (transglycosylase-associated protein family)
VGVIAWLVIGVIAGLVVDLVLDGELPGGLVGAALGGAAGAFLGGGISSILSDQPAVTVDVFTTIAALVGASLLLALARMADRAGARKAALRPRAERRVVQGHGQSDGRPDWLDRGR